MKPLREVFKKSDLKAIYDRHQADAKKYPKNSDMRAHHALQSNRASRLHSIAKGRVPKNLIDINLKYSREDRKRAQELKARGEGKKK